MNSTSTVPVQPRKGRGVLILVFGIVSLVFLGPFFGIPAWVMGHGDLKKIRQGIIDPSEEGLTKVGMILGIIGTFLILAVILFGMILAVSITVLNNR